MTPGVVPVRLALVAALFVAGAALVSRWVRPPGPAAPPTVAEAEADDSGEVIDFARLREKDLAFLEGLLQGEASAPRRSAIRALVVAEDMRGARLLLDAAAAGLPEDDALLCCLAALDVLRLQRHTDAAHALLRALERPGLPSGCVVELRDRFSLLARDGLDLLALAAAPEPEVRRWVARTLGEETGDEADALLVALAADEDVEVRRVAWLAWRGREPGGRRQALLAMAATEQDPSVQALAHRALEAPP